MANTRTAKRGDGFDWRPDAEEGAPPPADGRPASTSTAVAEPPVAVTPRRELKVDNDGVVDLSSGAELDGPVSDEPWDGRKTRFMLGFPLVRDQSYVHVGTRVDFSTSFTNGRWRGPEASTVAQLLRTGHFAGTPAYAERKRQQVVIDNERGLYRSKDDPQGAPPEGLHERTDAEVHASLDDMLRGGAAEMRRREQQEARTAGDENAEKLAAAITGAIKATADRE